VARLFLEHRRDIRFEATFNPSSILYIVAREGHFSGLPWLPFADTLSKFDGMALVDFATAQNHDNITQMLIEDEAAMSRRAAAGNNVRHTAKRARGDDEVDRNWGHAAEAHGAVRRRRLGCVCM